MTDVDCATLSSILTKTSFQPIDVQCQLPRSMMLLELHLQYRGHQRRGGHFLCIIADGLMLGNSSYFMKP